MEQKTTGTQRITLNRIVVPAHLRIKPVAPEPRDEVIEPGPVANSADAPDQDAEIQPPAPKAEPQTRVAPKPVGETLKAVAVEADERASGGSTTKKLGAAAAVLAVVVGVLLVTGRSAPDDEAIATASPSPDPAPVVPDAAPDVPLAVGELPLSEILSDVQPTVAVAPVAPPVLAVVRSPVPAPRPETPAVLGPGPDPVALPGGLVTPPLSATVVSVQPVVLAPVTPTQVPRPISAPPVGALPEVSDGVPPLRSGMTFLDRVTYGTVTALRAPVAPLPTAAESAIYGFVQSLGPDTRPEEDIAAMLQRAVDAGSLEMPPEYLTVGGAVDVRAILDAMAAR